MWAMKEGSFYKISPTLGGAQEQDFAACGRKEKLIE